MPCSLIDMHAYLLKLFFFLRLDDPICATHLSPQAAQQSARRAAAAAQESQTAQVASAAQNATWRC